TRTAATAAAAEAGLSGGAVRRERGAELLRDLRVPAVGARRVRIRHPDQLLEMGFAAHADVVVNRHRTDPSTGMVTPSPDGIRPTQSRRGSSRGSGGIPRAGRGRSNG